MTLYLICPFYSLCQAQCLAQGRYPTIVCYLLIYEYFLSSYYLGGIMLSLGGTRMNGRHVFFKEIIV